MRCPSGRRSPDRATEIADALRGFAAAGFTNVEVIVSPPIVVSVDAMAPVLELLDAV